jgi:hypothetical protein
MLGIRQPVPYDRRLEFASTFFPSYGNLNQVVVAFSFSAVVDPFDEYVP